jgi:hypothetical protein
MREVAEVHARGTGFDFWAMEREKTHRRTRSMVAGRRPVKLDGGRPEERWRESFVGPGRSSAPV